MIMRTEIRRVILLSSFLLSLIPSVVRADGGIDSAAAMVPTPVSLPNLAMSPTLAARTPQEAAAPVTNPVVALAELPGRGAHDAANDTPSDPARQTIDPPPQQAPANGIAPVTSEFQQFIAQSLGYILPRYGSELFHGAPSTFAPVDRVPVTPDYPIGPGDELQIHVWGQVEVNRTVTVDRNGMIDLPKVGMVSVAGVRYQNLAAHLKAAFGRMFRNFELDVALGKLRSIQVLVVGQAAHPGSYTISSLSTLVNALFASGGPSAKGSMRHIQLKRGNKLITELDLYALLLRGDKSKDMQLLNGDVIYIPTVGPQVAIAGSVNTPAIFELNDKETLADLLAMAGGMTNTAAGNAAAIERIVDHAARTVDEFQLNRDGLAKGLHDGDLVKIYAISPRFDNAITLRGNVAIPGRHPWKEGMRVSDVISSVDMLITNSYWLRQNRLAGTDVSSAAQLRNEVKHNRDEVNWDYAVIERFNPAELTTGLIPFNLGKAVIDHDQVQDMLLQPGDVITIFSKKDIQVPEVKRTKYVLLEGELAHPGVYQVLPGETLPGLVRRVGGLAPQAYLFGSEFTREATRQMQQKRLGEIIDRLEADAQRTAAQASSAALSRDELDATRSQAQAQQALIARMKQVKATGRIVMEMPARNPQIDDLPEIALEDGDRFYVPAVASTVNVMGTVYNQNAFVYRAGQSIGDYLDKAGGPTRDGDQNDVYLVRADGLVFSKRQGGSLFGAFARREAMPGDTIVVPEKLDKYNVTKDFKDWTQIFYQFAIGIASLKVLNIF